MLKSDPVTWTDRRQREGVEAEQLAEELLERCGYRVVAHRFRHHHNDVDVVARKGSLVVFVEVRYRAGGRFGTPAQSVTAAKRYTIARLAEAWLQRFGRPGDVARFDVIGVTRDRVEWLQSAFRPGWR